MITFEEPILENEEKKLLYEAISSSSVAQGPYVKRFEQSCAKYFNSRFACASFNGTTALHLALAALGIKKGDEVILPSFTFVATANVVSYMGATPVFVDIKKDTLCMNTQEVRKKITKKTKVVMPVHIYGNLCDMDSIKELADQHSLSIIEDACEAHGATYKGKKAGSMSDIGCLSFHFSKIARMGEGGISLTNNQELDEKMRLLRSQGKVKNEELKGDDFIEKRYYHNYLGFNYRMLDLQAAIGIAQVGKINNNIRERRKIAGIYDSEFKKYGIETMKKEEKSSPVYWMYPLMLKDRKTRLKVGRELVKRKMPFIPFFWPCHMQPFYNTTENLPVTNDIFQRGMVIPCNPLVTLEDAVLLAKIIGSAAKNA